MVNGPFLKAYEKSRSALTVELEPFFHLYLLFHEEGKGS